ncbi:MAG: adenine phosphoribosyltransferase [Elusimicrobia bacterium RIFOXYB2_FULL_48_7]|nr:MAG: adenine phosphoribosyltransferase [Elusimicrobia bacterium RIFOXYB2_FULL_48_7]
MDLKKIIRDVPDFPKKGVIFKDITTLLRDKDAFKFCIDELAKNYNGKKIDKILSMESRGFILGSALAYKLGCGFVPVRKKGKLPWQTVSITYDLEYGTDTLEMHKDAFAPGEKILIVDDVLATGGTAHGVTKLVENIGGKVEGLCFLIELSFLNPRKKLPGRNIFSLLTY